MYLKSIEIQGFKSFPDHTEIDLSRGITAIVGPNGSGKSNIVDAVRWVLGEQSTKTLRGGKMEDVIFGGTTKRAPSGYAQVSLTIDNAEGILPIEYAEITVTRRYYRSGESEFFLNRKSVRLKDVHELFMDTGLGRDGYSIIGQGKIDDILAVKSGDRREIFEEAAGITKFRYRKDEAQKKLEGTEENLVRIRDIVGELTVQVEPLAVQAKKAQSFLLLRDDLRVLEVSTWCAQLTRIKESLSAHRVDFDNAERMLSAKKSKIEDCYKNIEDYSDSIRRCDMELENIRNESARCAGDDGEIKSFIAVCDTEIKNAEQNIDRLRGELGESELRADNLENQKQSRQDRIAQIEQNDKQIYATIMSLESQNSEKDVHAAEFSQKLTEHTDELRALRAKQSECGVEYGSAKSAVDEIAPRCETIDVQMHELNESLAELSARNLTLVAQEEKHKEDAQSAQNMLNGFALLATNMEKKAELAKEKWAQAERAFNAAHDRISLLSAMEREYEGFSRAVRAVMQASQAGALKNIHGTVAEIIKTPDEYGIAIEIALGAALQNIVLSSEQDGKAAIGYLKSRDYGRATFLPMSTMRARKTDDVFFAEPGYIGMADKLVQFEPEYAGVIGNLLGNTLIVEHLDSAIAIGKKYPGRVRIVTLDGQIVNQSGAMTGGSVGKSVGILSRANELARLSENIKKMEQELELLSHTAADSAQELSASKYQSEVAQKQLESAGYALKELATQAAGHAELTKIAQDRLLLLTEEKAQTEARRVQCEQIMKFSCAKIDEIDTKCEALQKKIDELYDTQAQINRHSEQVSEAIGVERTKLVQNDAERAGLRDTIAQLNQLLDSAQGEHMTKSSSIEKLMATIENSRAQKVELSLRSEQIQSTIHTLSQNSEILLSKKMELDQARTMAQKDSQNMAQDILNMEREASRLQNKNTQEEMEEKAIFERMWDSYELTPMTAVDVAQPITNATETGRQLNDTRAEIKKLGDVNIAAIEEYARVSERYEFLSTQLSDLETAKLEILKIIKELTANMQDVFATQFKLINENFSQTFREIFGGGNAYLQLEDESDILNCGIEIKVELPGKTIKTISLLSGGEKAFVAIALYFAILKVRPTPFCVLDEIEAALDDVNVVKYITYMHTLCDSTQFIVITHRRGTMEGSDILYGVTMQEMGVSKLLSINVNQVEKELGISQA